MLTNVIIQIQVRLKVRLQVQMKCGGVVLKNRPAVQMNNNLPNPSIVRITPVLFWPEEKQLTDEKDKR